MKAEKAAADELQKKGKKFYDKTELNKALGCWEKAKEIYEELGNKREISRMLITIGIVYRDKGDLEHALECLKKGQKISEEVGNEEMTPYALNGIGLVNLDRGDWKSALKCFEKGLEFKGDKLVTAYLHKSLGRLYKDRGDWESALENFEESRKIFININIDTPNKRFTETLNLLGNVYKNKGDWERAFNYFEESLEFSNNHKYEAEISYALNNLGELSINNGNWDEAERYLEKSLATAEKLTPLPAIDALANLGELFRLEERYEDAFAKLEKALQKVNQVGRKPKEIDIYEKLGDTHLDKYIAYKTEENLSSAEENYTLAYKRAKSLNMPLQKATAIRGIGTVQAKKGNLAASKKSFKKSIKILRDLGACFELQKALLEYAKILYETDVLVEAEMVAKASAFDAMRNNYQELLVKIYLLLGDIEMRIEKQYEYYLEALKASEFNSKIYVRTCFIMIFRMKNMERQILLKFIDSLKEFNKDKDKYFDQFLEALKAKIETGKYDVAGLPDSLEQEIINF